MIIHLDIDCFFVQAEIQNQRDLEGKAVAVYQHEDIIAVSYEARALGVKKHDVPSQIRLKFPEVTLISVPCEPGTTKVSYDKVKFPISFVNQIQFLILY